jgi:hypothetical protein
MKHTAEKMTQDKLNTLARISGGAMLAKKPTVKFDLSEIDPDHLDWLRQEASSQDISVDDMLLDAHQGGAYSDPAFSERDQNRVHELAQSVELEINVSDPRLKMALKRQAARHGCTVEEYVAHEALVMLCAAENDCQVSLLTGEIIE